MRVHKSGRKEAGARNVITLVKRRKWIFKRKDILLSVISEEILTYNAKKTPCVVYGRIYCALLNLLNFPLKIQIGGAVQSSWMEKGTNLAKVKHLSYT